MSTLGTEPVDSQTSPDRPTADPLAGHRRRLRRARRWYAVGLTVVAIGLALIVGRVWATSEITHTTLHPATGPAPTVPLQTPPAALSLRWRTSDRVALGTPVGSSGGTVVTWSQHTVSDRDARTGAVRWRYTRSDRRLCGVIVASNRAVAIYAHDANCDEVTAIAVDTGTRAWTRTLTDNGTPTLAANAYTVLLTTPAQVHAVDPASGIDRWIYTQPAGCRTTSAVLGSSGTLIAQHCATGEHLLLRDPYKGTDDKNGVVLWTHPSSLIPVAADSVIAALDPAHHRLAVLAQKDGSELSGVPVSAGAAADPARIAQTAAGNTELVWLSGALYALQQNASAPIWTSATSGPPTVASAHPGQAPDNLDAAVITAATADGITRLDPRTGQPADRWPVPAPATGWDHSTVYPIGSGFLVGDAAATVVYQ